MAIKTEENPQVARFTSGEGINWKDKDYADFFSLVRSMRGIQNEYAQNQSKTNLHRMRSFEKAVDLKIAEMQSPEANK